MPPEAARPNLGLDLGGTNIKWSVLEQAGDDWHVLVRDQLPTRAAEGPAAVVERLGNVARDAVRDFPQIASIGVGLPGVYDATAGTARFLPNLPGDWDGLPVAAPISTLLNLPVALINDARAFGLAELRLGAGRGVESMVGLALGTGIGGVVVIDGRVHLGHDGTAGEVGHQIIDPDGPPCTCGGRGCLEAYAGSQGIADACGTSTAEEAVEAARAGDRRAREGIERVGRYLGIGIANLVVVLTPDRVVLGGGVAAAGDLLLEPIRAELRRRVHTTDLAQVELVIAELGTWAGSIGAAIHGAEALA